jgi:DNA polymerase-3 subunit delta'
MNNSLNKINISIPINQLTLYGYDDYFKSFINLYNKNKLPQVILLSGQKGFGKATFAFHLVNCLLSQNEIYKYEINNFHINEDNSTYKLINSQTCPNFFLVQKNKFDSEIKVEKIRDLLKFLNKSSFSNNVKFILIDNAETLNQTSSNALLKEIEEPSQNTFFFIIHNNSFKLLDTIRSRCNEFKVNFSKLEKIDILKKISSQYKISLDAQKLVDNYYFESPGNLFRYFYELSNNNINISSETLKCILYFIDKFNSDKDPDTLFFITLFIEKFYNELCLINKNNQLIYFNNLSKILKQLNDLKKFNLDKKNVLVWVKNILQNEK